jgi:hypothetical protein
MCLLAAFFIGNLGAALTRGADPSPTLVIVRTVLGLIMMLLLLGAIVLGIIGLIDYSQNKSAYNQGRAQAIWTLAITGIMGLIAISAFIKGVRQTAFGPVPYGTSRPGEMLAFDNLNFRFRAPDRPWVSIDGSKLNKASAATFTRRAPEAYFFIVAEQFSPQMEITSEKSRSWEK